MVEVGEFKHTLEPTACPPEVNSISGTNFGARSKVLAIARTTALPPIYSNHSNMSGKYAFTRSLKELRFLFCQRSDHSAAARSELSHFVLVYAHTNKVPIPGRFSQGHIPP